MGYFDFEKFAQLSPIEQLMRQRYDHVFPGEAPADDVQGLETIFEKLKMGQEMRTLALRYDNFREQASQERFQREMGLEELREPELQFLITVITTFEDYLIKKDSTMHYLDEHELIAFGPQYNFDLRMRYHDRYWPVPPHSHDFVELVVLLKGSCRHLVGRDYVSMRTGDIVVVPPRTSHQLIATNDESLMFNIQLRPEAFEQNFMDLLMRKHVLSDFFRSVLYAREDGRSYLLIRTENYFLGENLLADIYREIQSDHLYKQEILNALCKLFFLHLLEHYVDHIYTSGISEETTNTVEIMTYIQQSHGRVTMEELSARFNYSPRQISRLIGKFTGSTFRDLRRELRLKRAGQLLTETRLSVEEVARSSGYQNSNHFFTDFKEYYHTTPLAFRRDAAPPEPGELRVDADYLFETFPQ